MDPLTWLSLPYPAFPSLTGGTHTCGSHMSVIEWQDCSRQGILIPRCAPHPSWPHRSSAFVCMTCGPAELRRPSTFYHSHTRLDAVCLLRCSAPIRTPAPSNFHLAAMTHFVPGINPQLEYLCTTGSTRRCGHLRLVTPRCPAVAPSPRPRHHRPVHLERVSREPCHHHENDMWARRI